MELTKTRSKTHHDPVGRGADEEKQWKVLLIVRKRKPLLHKIEIVGRRCACSHFMKYVFFFVLGTYVES
jgi:hypothetical protein